MRCWPPEARLASANAVFISSADPRERERESEICRNPERSNGLICVVAESRDLLAMERTREFQGSYHVLGGLISPMDGVGPELLQISSLVKRLGPEDISEVILALTPSVEGDTTSLYLARLIKPFCAVSRIAYGLPMGSELEYADEVTLSRALKVAGLLIDALFEQLLSFL